MWWLSLDLDDAEFLIHPWPSPVTQAATRRLIGAAVLWTLALVIGGCGPAADTPEPDTGEMATCGDGQLDPLEECDDGNSSLGDGCGADCLLEPCTDADGDGHCAQADCDDLDAEVAPGLAEITCNEKDDDCEPDTDDAPDRDGDGYSLCEEDCDDDPLSAPSNDEQCHGELDEDCDGDVDCWDEDCQGEAECVSDCGNDLLEPGEECDDGNTSTGDGCSAGCRTELQEEPAGSVVDAPGDTGVGFRDANNAVNGVRGGGGAAGGTDVFSLGYNEGVDNYIVIRWPGAQVLNGPGVDFVVFENAFASGSSTAHFMDHVVVYLSRDQQTWVSFPHDYLAADESLYSALPGDWHGFAGVNPVLLNEDDNPVDPFEGALAGGDPFDLSDLPDDDGAAQEIKTLGFTFLKLVTAPTVVNPDTELPYVRDLVSNGADIDGVYARYLVAQ
jgi:cysteine-rich repeat protein